MFDEFSSNSLYNIGIRVIFLLEKREISMDYLIRLIFLVTVSAKFTVQGSLSEKELAILLILAALNILKHKYRVAWPILAVELVIISIGCIYSSNFVVLYGLIGYDLGIVNILAFVIPTALLALYFSPPSCNMENAAYILLTFMFGRLNRKFADKIDSFKETYDNERRYRYELETAKQRLLNSAKETAYIAEIKERNRIAREIHDTVGHSIAGILIQLQAVQKLMHREEKKAEELLKDSVERLSDTLDVMRNTVHNLRPSNNMSLEYIKNIISNFNYCRVDFSHSGDFNSLPPNIMEAISSDIKEALTNAYKYSKATVINIKIDITEAFVRVYIKDNGEGCANLKEGFGLLGIRERVRNLAGNVSINGENGFMLVIIIPLQREKGVVIFEGNNS